MSLEVEDKAWPIATARWSGVIRDEELTVALARLDGFFARGERFGFLIDARGGKGFSPEQRARVMAHMKSTRELSAKLLVQAIVIDNLMIRSLYYGANLIFPNPFPSKVFAEPVAAHGWLVTTLELPVA